jgi:hypothetical protein
MPERGSLQDRVACEMLLRERRRQVQSQTYLGRIMAASVNLPEKLFSLWTTLYSMEVFQSNYSPEVVEDKEEALKAFRDTAHVTVVERTNYLQKLETLTARDEDLRPATPEEIEEAKRRLRRRRVRTRGENT